MLAHQRNEIGLGQQLRWFSWPLDKINRCWSELFDRLVIYYFFVRPLFVDVDLEVITLKNC